MRLEIADLGQKLLGLPMKWEYQKRHPEHGDDESHSREQAAQVMDAILKSDHLPPHQCSKTFTRLAEDVRHLSTKSVVEDALWYDAGNRSFARYFNWRLGQDFPSHQGELDTNAMIRIIEREGAFMNLTVSSVFLPHQRHICAARFTAFYLDQKGLEAERGTTLIFPYDQASNTYDLDMLPMMIPLFPAREVRKIEFNETGTKVHILDENQWQTMYYVADQGRYRYFFARGRDDTGRRRPEFDEQTLHELSRLFPRVAAV